MSRFVIPSNNDAGFTIRMDGVIELLSPYASSWPADRKKGEKGGKNEPLPLPKMIRNNVETPFITAASLRGALRRSAMDVVLSVSGKKLATIADYYLNAVGGAKGRKVTSESDVGTTAGDVASATAGDAGNESGDNDPDADAENAKESKKVPEAGLTDYIAARKRNPILGIFGAGEVMGSMMNGHLSMGNAIPDTFSVGVYRGVRQDDTRVRPELVDRSVESDDLEETVRELHDRARNHTALKAKIAALRRTLATSDKKSAEYKTAEVEIKAAEKEEKGIKDVTVMQPLSGFEYLNPTTMPHGMALKNVSKVEAGLFFLAISRLMDDPFLGAHDALGFGKVRAAWTVQVSGDDRQAELKAEPYEGIECDHPFVAEAIGEALEAIRTGSMVLTVPTVKDLAKSAA